MRVWVCFSLFLSLSLSLSLGVCLCVIELSIIAELGRNPVSKHQVQPK